MTRHVYLVGDEVKSTVLDDAILCAAAMKPAGELRMHFDTLKVIKDREYEDRIRKGISLMAIPPSGPSIQVRCDGRVPVGQVHVTAPQ